MIYIGTTLGGTPGGPELHPTATYWVPLETEYDTEKRLIPSSHAGYTRGEERYPGGKNSIPMER